MILSHLRTGERVRSAVFAEKRLGFAAGLGLLMSYCTLLVSVTVVTLCLSIVLIQEVRVLKTDLNGIKRDLHSPLAHRSVKEFSYGLFMSSMWEVCQLIIPFKC